MSMVIISEIYSQPGTYEIVEKVNTNPRRDGDEGVWGNGITEFHWIGRKSGLIAIEKRQIGGFTAWFDPEKNELPWGYEPQFTRVNLDTVYEQYPQINWIII